MQIVYINIFDINYPLIYTVSAQNAIAERYGGIEKIQEVLGGGDAAGVADAVIFMLAQMMKGAEERRRIQCRVLGQEFDGPKALSYEELLVLGVNDMERVMNKVVATMQGGEKTEVEVQESKNAEATPE